MFDFFVWVVSAFIQQEKHLYPSHMYDLCTDPDVTKKKKRQTIIIMSLPPPTVWVVFIISSVWETAVWLFTVPHLQLVSVTKSDSGLCLWWVMKDQTAKLWIVSQNKDLQTRIHFCIFPSPTIKISYNTATWFSQHSAIKPHYKATCDCFYPFRTGLLSLQNRFQFP